MDTVIESREQAQQIFDEMDAKRIKRFHDRTKLANKLASGIDEDLYGDESFEYDHLELIKLKRKAHRSIGILEKIKSDPKFRINLVQHKNRDLGEKLKSQVIDSISNAVGRIKASIDVINSHIDVTAVESEKGDNELSDVDPEYVKFWMQFSKLNPKTNRSYLEKEEVYDFIRQAFLDYKYNKTFNPDMNVTELRHAAWLFRRNYKFGKRDITRIMMNNFPNYFSGTFNNEYSNIKDQDAENKGKRIFKSLDQ